MVVSRGSISREGDLLGERGDENIRICEREREHEAWAFVKVFHQGMYVPIVGCTAAAYVRRTTLLVRDVYMPLAEVMNHTKAYLEQFAKKISFPHWDHGTLHTAW